MSGCADRGGGVPCRWAAGALRCPAPAEMTRGLRYAERLFCRYHQGVTDKRDGDFIMHELLAGRKPEKRKPPEEFMRLKARLSGNSLKADDVVDVGVDMATDDAVPVLYSEDEPLFAEAVAIGRRRYADLRRAGVPGDVAINQAFFAVANWER